MIRINISHSPLSVTLFTDDGSGTTYTYTGTIEHILNQIVPNAYDIGRADEKAGVKNVEVPTDELHREIVNYSRDVIDNGPNLEETDATD
jgi:hypothetical protein